MRLHRRKPNEIMRKGVEGWVLTESLLSLVVFALIMGILTQQNKHDFNALSQMKTINQDDFSRLQILKVRAIKQDYEWLEGSYKAGAMNECSTCAESQLEPWLLNWISSEEKVSLLSSDMLLGVDE